MKNNLNNIVIYQAKNGAIEFRGDFDKGTVWASKKQISDLFEIDRSVVSRHISNILKDKELDVKQVCAKFAHTTKHGALADETQTRMVSFYSLDIILAVGYRTKSAKAVEFRRWATKILKQHLLDGYTFNKKRISQNYGQFIKAISSIKVLLPINSEIKTTDVLELVNIFASTWVSLEAYDKDNLPKIGLNKNKVSLTARELSKALLTLKKELISKNQATDVFGMERNQDSIDAIAGNVFQSAFGKDVYITVEEKAVHLLYFIVKNHPFVDGNKRSGAFAFVWFLNKANILSTTLTPEALTTLTLLIASSSSRDKEKMVGLVLLLLKTK